MGQEALAPKGGARFNFEMPGSVQGFLPEESIESKGTVWVENVVGHSQRGERSLALRYQHVAWARPARVATATFIPAAAAAMPGYGLLASPTIYPGQIVRGGVAADASNALPITCRLYLRRYGAGDELVRVYGPEAILAPGAVHEFAWKIEEMGGAPIAEVGVEISSRPRADGTVYLDYLTWAGAPDVALIAPADGGTMWRRAWVNGVDQFSEWAPETYRLIQNSGRGLLMQGTREWGDYQVEAVVTPHMAQTAGIAARVQGMRRYYALLLCGDNKVRLVKALDGDTTLAEAECAWQPGTTHTLMLRVKGRHLEAIVNGRVILRAEDSARPLSGGGIALVCEEGRCAFDAVSVRPIGAL
jgi:hypothetical protein